MCAGCSHPARCQTHSQIPIFPFFPSVDGNEEFVAAVGALAERVQCPLTVCPALPDRPDRWIQVGAGPARALCPAAALGKVPKFSIPSPG